MYEKFDCCGRVKAFICQFHPLHFTLTTIGNIIYYTLLYKFFENCEPLDQGLTAIEKTAHLICKVFTAIKYWNKSVVVLSMSPLRDTVTPCLLASCPILAYTETTHTSSDRATSVSSRVNMRREPCKANEHQSRSFIPMCMKRIGFSRIIPRRL